IAEIEDLKVSQPSAGRIATMPVEVGQKVREGDVLATLDARDVDVRLRAAKADLDRCRARLAAWMKEARPAGDAPDPRLLPFEQDLRAQEAKVAELEMERAKTQVLSPAAGTVSLISARVGEWRTAGTDLVQLVVP